MSDRFRHEDIASVPAGWKVRTVTTSGGHRVRVAFPPGRRVKGSGRLVSILHPLAGSNPCGNPCTLRSTNPQELMVMGANPPRRRVSDPAVRHQIKIAKQTLRMSDVMARVMGGMTKDEARQVLRQYGIKYSENNRTNPQTLDAFTKKHLATWLDRAYLYGADKRHAKKIILAILKREPDLLAEGKSWPEILRMGEAAGINPRRQAMPSNPYFSEKMDQGSDRVVIWANTEAGPFHVQPYVNMPDGNAIRERGRGYSTLKRARKVAQKWLDEQREYKRRNPHELLVMAANPRVEVVHGENPPVEEIHEEFTGVPVEWLDVYNEPHMPRGRYAQLGPLIALYVKPAKGGQVMRIGAPENHEDFADWWDKKPPIIVTDSSARQIYFVDGCQDVSPLLEQLGAVEARPGISVLGQVRRIDYQCRKEHVADPDEDRWKHNHGDEDGQLPTLMFDQQAKRLLYEGGNYRIEGPWIRN